MSDLLYSLLLFPFFFIIPIAAQSNDSSYPNCGSYRCGNINISYPFWRIGSESTTQFCGYPAFGINCSYDGERSFPSITLGNDSYSIPNIIYERESIVLIDDDVSNAVSIMDCPRVRHNITIGTLPFVFVNQNVNLSFHFNCTGVPSFASEIPCLSSPIYKSCVNRVNSEPSNFNWEEFSCDEDVVTTVLDVSGSESRLGTEFIGALRGGFELRWGRIEDCEKCEESGGRCGYNRNTTEFLCFCSSGTTSVDHCRGSRQTAWRIKLVVGIGSALLVFALMFIIYFVMILISSPNKFVTFFKHQTEDDKNVEAFVIQYGSLSTKRYTYSDIKIMTNSFRVKLGQGGFGTVFRGTLSDGRLVAVKILNSSKASGQEFINEVASIGRTSHINIVALLGFCFEYCWTLKLWFRLSVYSR